jgi:hypothetical protein
MNFRNVGRYIPAARHHIPEDLTLKHIFQFSVSEYLVLTFIQFSIHARLTQVPGVLHVRSAFRVELGGFY